MGIGVHNDTIADWRKVSPSFQADMDKALAEYACEHVGVINAAAKRGGWKASAHMLGAHPSTREEYGNSKATGGGNTINVVLNIPLPVALPDVIDVTPEEVQ